MECEVTGLGPEQRAALEMDSVAVQLARRRGGLDVTIGEALLRLFDGDRLLQLGFARQVDYARERLGVSARSLYLWLRLARGLATRPLLRRAVVAGVVSPRKALAVLPVATGAEERAWTSAAVGSTLAALEAAVRSSGADPPIDSFQATSLVMRMDASQQDRLDAAIALAQESLDYGAPRWRCIEAICQEWLGEFGAWCPDVEGQVRSVPPAQPEHAFDIARLLETTGAEKPEALGDAPARELDAKVIRLIAIRRGYDGAFGAIAARVVDGRTWSVLGYRSLAEYCRERLGVSPRSLRERVWLERRMCALPALRRALASGRVTYSKALLVAKDATSADIGDRLREAEGTTWQQLDRESTAREDRRNRAAGVRRVWGPEEAAQVVVDAILGAQALASAQGSRIEAGEALARIADHFVQVWIAHSRPPWASRERRRVMLRHRGLCAVPGCTRPARHEHHVQFRSRGGSGEPANRLAVCAAHHLHGIHRGYLTVTGRAGEQLIWNLGTGGADTPLETWITERDDDVRRVHPEEALRATA